MAIGNLAILREQYASNDIRPSASAAQQHVRELLNYVGGLEEALLAAAQLLYPDEDWGPQPPHDGPGRDHSYEGYLSEGVHGQAIKVRDQWKARRWVRA